MGPSNPPPESELLRRSWERCDAATLDQYLVAGVEDPRINVPSILTRSLLCDSLFPGRYTRLIEEELRFGFAMTWLLTQPEQGVESSSLLATAVGKGWNDQLDFIRDALHHFQHNTCLPDHAADHLKSPPQSRLLPSQTLDTYQAVWRRELADASHDGCSLFEPACGSANDFRYLASSGLGRFVRYTGIDVAPKNIANARRHFPDVDFRNGDLLDNGFADGAFDYSFVHDLFEHLSPDAAQQSIREILRITRREAWLHFFNAADMSSHHIRKVGSYYWNTLSIGRLLSLVEQYASHVEVVSIAELARAKCGLTDYYNLGAYAIIASR